MLCSGQLLEFKAGSRPGHLWGLGFRVGFRGSGIWVRVKGLRFRDV